MALVMKLIALVLIVALVIGNNSVSARFYEAQEDDSIESLELEVRDWLEFLNLRSNDASKTNPNECNSVIYRPIVRRRDG